jgi:hypothetical protein
LIDFSYHFLTIFLFREIEIESDDETLYQSKRSSQIKRDQHSSLPDLTETLSNSSKTTYNNSENSDHIEPSSSTSSVSTTALLSPKSPIELNIKSKSIINETVRKKILIIFILGAERPQSAGGNNSSPNVTPKTSRKMVRKIVL